MRLLVLLIFALTAGGSSAWAAYESKGKRDPFVPLLLPTGERVNPPPDEEGAGKDSAGRKHAHLCLVEVGRVLFLRRFVRRTSVAARWL